MLRMVPRVTLQPSPQANSDRIAVKASPRGIRAGFAVIGDGVGGALTFTVMPKPWGKDRAAVFERQHQAGTSTHITLFELDTVEVVTDSAVRDRIAQGLLETRSIGEADMASRDGCLLERVRLTGRDGLVGSASSFGGLEDIVRLMLLAKRDPPSLGPAGYRGTAAASMLRIVTQQMFLEEVGRVIDRARPRYRTRTDSLRTPRGKLSAQSLALALATGRPTIESRFDDLSTDTDLLRIVLAALNVVATCPAPRLLATLADPLRSRAVAFARRMDSVSILDRERALLAYSRLTVTPLDRPWKPALDLAADVLALNAVIPEGDRAETSHTYTFSLHMEEWWEKVLADAISIRADKGSVFAQRPVKSPWRGGNVGYIDLYFALGGHAVLADAKYKPISETIGSADGYQLFAYSHTAVSSELGRPEIAAVLYPARGAADGGTRKRLRRRTKPKFMLYMIELPFPGRDDVLTDLTWRAYLERVASKIDLALRPGLIDSTATVGSEA